MDPLDKYTTHNYWQEFVNQGPRPLQPGFALKQGPGPRRPGFALRGVKKVIFAVASSFLNLGQFNMDL